MVGLFSGVSLNYPIGWEIIGMVVKLALLLDQLLELDWRLLSFLDDWLELL